MSSDQHGVALSGGGAAPEASQGRVGRAGAEFPAHSKLPESTCLGTGGAADGEWRGQRVGASCVAGWPVS